ncbi:hypothetical protein DRP53_10215 [candidate division WOR-3 bacterium]|uniref:FlgD/Vpr Ig-like domain-containing protein n=1 Tax=candidate division WOR-3 bacterium TaxID=2052148 RepID=A0A660SDF1_UNCW3|nr:MAG: hypothetical protein DRP53_10215 [candidate division WOR-3 bacterium]
MRAIRATCLIWAILIVDSLFAQAPDTLWTKTYGGEGYDDGFAVRQTSDSGFIVVGSAVPAGATYADVYLIKTDAHGSPIWIKTYGDLYTAEAGRDVEETLDGGYIVVGNKSGDFYILKTDSNGDTLWTKIYDAGGNCDYATSVDQTSDGGYIVVGRIWNFFQPGDIWLLRLDTNGDSLWSRAFRGPRDEGGESVKQTSDGGYVIGGFTSSTPGEDYDILVIKTDDSGAMQWLRRYGGSETDLGYSILQTSDKGYVICGFTCSSGEGDEDYYLVKTDSEGNIQWAKTYGGHLNDYALSVDQTSDGGYILTGSTESFGAGEYDLYVVRTTASGETVWTQTYGGPIDDLGRSGLQTNDDGYIFVGITYSLGSGEGDVYLIRTKPEGVRAEEFSYRISSTIQIAPNPFCDNVWISYALKMRTEVNITLYNLLGQEVKILVDGEENPGVHTIIWDGRDAAGQELPDGIYILELSVGAQSRVLKKVIKF